MDEDSGSGNNVVDTAGSGGGSAATVVSSPPSGNTMAAFSAAAVQALAPGLFDSPMVSSHNVVSVSPKRGKENQSLSGYTQYFLCGTPSNF